MEYTYKIRRRVNIKTNAKGDTQYDVTIETIDINNDETVKELNDLKSKVRKIVL